MKVVCSSCENESGPAFMGEQEPLDDSRITHGLCPEHQERLRQEIEAIPAQASPPKEARFALISVAVPVIGRATQFPGMELRGMIRNVDAKGVMAEFPVRVAPGSPMCLTLRRRQETTEVRGQVVWTAAAGKMIHHGIAFAEPMAPDAIVHLFLDETSADATGEVVRETSSNRATAAATAGRRRPRGEDPISPTRRRRSHPVRSGPAPRSET
jgi:hypothetical protein